MKLVKFALSEFGPLIVFVLANHFFGPRPAIISSIAFTIAAVAYKLAKKAEFTNLFKFTVIVTLFFGSLDLYLKTPVFFQYEATITNIITGIYFGLSLFSKKTLIQEFMEKQKGTENPEAVGAYRLFTVIWTLYFFVKAACYGYISATHSYEEALLIRSTAGTASFYVLLGISLFFGKPVTLFFRKLGLVQ